jgi:hypothetical protein
MGTTLQFLYTVNTTITTTRRRTMSLTGPYNRALDQEKHVCLGGTTGSWDRDYYLFENGTVWCFESPNNAYSNASWYAVEERDWDRVVLEGRTVRELVEEKRGRLS